MSDRDLKTRLASLAVLLLVLVSGFVIGLAWDRSLGASTAPEVVAEEEPAEEEEPRSLIIDRVGLSAEQKAAVDGIVAFHRARIKELNEEFNEEYSPRFRTIVLATRDSLKTVLRPEQAAMYDSLTAEFDRRRDEEQEPDAGDEGQDAREDSRD